MQASNRIIVNTLAQYIRTVANVLLSLYSVRLVFDLLGVEDYGIYALVAGVISMLSFFTNSLVSSTQRFLSVTQGRGNLDELKKVFSNSLLLHILIGFVVLLVLGALTPLLFNGFLNIPAERVNAAKVVYLIVLLMVYSSFLAAPYKALLVSRENIVYTSVIEMLDGVLKVVLVLFLYHIPYDKLIAYGWIMLAISLFSLFAFAVYGHRKYEECIRPRLSLFSRTYMVSLFKFTGWTTYSTLSIAIRNQGFAIVLNKLLGTAVNAAYGIGMQVCGMLSFINSSFNNAVAPQLMSSEGGGDRERMWRLAQVGSKFPFLLLAMIGIPAMFEMQTLLHLWLGNVPPYTVMFACTFLIMQMIDQMTSGLGLANKAIGNIGFYTVVTYTPKLLILPLGWFILHLGYDMEIVCALMIVIELVCTILRIPLLNRMEGFKPWRFVQDVFLRTMPPVVFCVMICTLVSLISASLKRMFFSFAFSIPVFGLAAYVFSLSPLEKGKIRSFLKKIR